MVDLGVWGKPSNHMKGYLYSYPIECIKVFLTIKKIWLSLYNRLYTFFFFYFFFYLAPSRIDFGKKIFLKQKKKKDGLSFIKVLCIANSTSLGSLQKFEGAAGVFKGALGSQHPLI